MTEREFESRFVDYGTAFIYDGVTGECLYNPDPSRAAPPRFFSPTGEGPVLDPETLVPFFLALANIEAEEPVTLNGIELLQERN
jgi:hypothetical protein